MKQLFLVVFLVILLGSCTTTKQRTLRDYRNRLKCKFVVESVNRARNGSIITLNGLKGRYFLPTDTLKVKDTIVINYVYRLY